MLKRLGRFEITRLIGTGAMGEVYLGLDPGMRREVAIKTIVAAASSNPQAMERFNREARAAGALNHPNVVTIHEFGEDQGVLFLVMEFVKGESLEALIQKSAEGRHDGLSKAEFLEVLAQVCDALAHAHQHSVIHRDIKPANIRVFREGSRLHAKVMDFGVAQLVEADLTTDGGWMGTVSYMAPEYLDTGKADARADLFAVGVMLFEALTGGKKPFPGEVPSVILNRILMQPPESLEPQDMEGISPLINAVMHRTLAKRPDDRYQDAVELADALRDAQDPNWAGDGRLSLTLPSDLQGDSGIVVARLQRRESKPAPVPEGVLIVSRTGNGHCLSLNVALRRAVPGTRIFVMPGTYKESIVLDKPVEIIGNGLPSEVILESSEAACVTMACDQALLSGLTLRARAKDKPVVAVDVPQGRLTVENCDLSADKAVTLAVHGSRADPLLRGCRIHGGTEEAIRCWDASRGTFERCEVQKAAGAGVRVEGRADPAFRKCKVHHNGAGGLVVLKDGRGSFEECNVYRNAGAGVRLEASSNAYFSKCMIHDGEELGLQVTDHGQGLLEDCDLFANGGSNVHVSDGAAPLLRRCKIHDGKEFGVFATDRGLGTYEECQIYENKLSGVVISYGANPLLRHCQIHEGKGLGVQVNDQGLGTLEDCDIEGNKDTGVKVGKGGNLMVRRCRIRGGRNLGVLFADNGQGTLEDCEILGNEKGGVKIAKLASANLRGGRIQEPIQREGGLGDVLGMFGLSR